MVLGFFSFVGVHPHHRPNNHLHRRKALTPMQPKPHHKNNPEGPRLFVGNIAYHITHENLTRFLLRDLNLSPIDIHLVCHRETGESRGYAFLEFRTTRQAEEALEILNRALFAKRSLRASWATERKDKAEPQNTNNQSNDFQSVWD